MWRSRQVRGTRDRPPCGPGAALLGLLVLVSACVSRPPAAGPPVRLDAAPPLLAVFPVENLTGHPAPLAAVQGLLAERLAGYGVRVLDDDTLERVVTKYRVRYTAGVEQRFARALQQETGAEAIVIPSLERYDEPFPPRVALFARLVSTGDAPTVRWTDASGAAGDDAPGLLGLGLVDDPRELLVRQVDAVAASLVRHLADASADGRRPGPKKFRPKLVYRSEALDPARTYSVAVVPFFNKSPRKYAGEIIALHMIRNLLQFPNLQVVEPGIVREELLRYRIIMSEGVSLPDTDTILNAVNADLVLNGEILDYYDPPAQFLAPSVDFAVLFIERRSRRVVYSSYSQNAGDDGVFFFDVGRVNTAHAMAAEMARAIGERMLLAPPTVRRPPQS